MPEPIVPADFEIPAPPSSATLRLEPLQPRHNEADLAAWSSSVDHIRATPGMGGRNWPPDEPFTLEQNLGDLVAHEQDFAARTGFTYTVLDPATSDVIGCVYLYPTKDGDHIRARSWVRASHAREDAALYRLVSDWLAADWPWTDVEYAPRESS